MRRGQVPALGCPRCHDPRPGRVVAKDNRQDRIERVRMCETCGGRHRTREVPAGLVRRRARGRSV
jgi:transcriptional regulator NrdR family protein